MPRIEITDKVYFLKSLIIFISFSLCLLIMLIIVKGWYKNIIDFIKRKK